MRAAPAPAGKRARQPRLPGGVSRRGPPGGATTSCPAPSVSGSFSPFSPQPIPPALAPAPGTTPASANGAAAASARGERGPAAPGGAGEEQQERGLLSFPHRRSRKAAAARRSKPGGASAAGPGSGAAPPRGRTMPVKKKRKSSGAAAADDTGLKKCKLGRYRLAGRRPVPAGTSRAAPPRAPNCGGPGAPRGGGRAVWGPAGPRSCRGARPVQVRRSLGVRPQRRRGHASARNATERLPFPAGFAFGSTSRAGSRICPHIRSISLGRRLS